MDRRVVITGMGAITPLGNNVESFWNNIKEGVNGIDFIKGIDVSKLKIKVAAQVKDFNPEGILERKEIKRLDKFSQYAIAAADEAIKMANLDLEAIDRNRMGVIVGSGIGGFETNERETLRANASDTMRINPLFIPMVISNMAAGNIAIKFGAKGTCTSIVTACATGTHSIGEAYRNIKHGYSDIILAGGTEASVTALALSGFSALTALSNSDNPDRASIPFDKDRDGFVMGEGAGILVVEDLEGALKRGAKIYGEIVGYGSTCDAYHITSPAPDGEGAARAMEEAIKEAGISKEEISYINAHGTSTEINDKFETLAIKKVFGEKAYDIPVSSTKSMTGHLLGAAGAVEAIVCVKALQDNYIPPTIGYLNKDEECDLDYVPNKGREAEINYTLSNSLGFGGHNAVLLIKKFNQGEV